MIKNLLLTLLFSAATLSAMPMHATASAANAPAIVPAPLTARFDGTEAMLPREVTVGVDDAALNQSYLLSVLEECGFGDICISVKCSRVPVNMAAYELLHEKVDYPLHLGVTEAGTPEMGVLKSAIGIGGLLCRGIGDTLRVSLTADPVEEVVAAKRILQACGLRQTGPDLIACPTCGRTKYDMMPIAREVERRLKNCDKPITVAVMGCVVNGPGEAAAADVGIAGGKGEGLLFAKGKVLRKVPEDQLVDALFEEIDKL